MRLSKQIEKEGGFLFRWRSYLPLALAPLCLLAMAPSVRMEQAMGEGLDHLWFYLCLAVSVLGLVIRWVALATAPAGTSGRNAKKQVAEVLNTTGLYSVCRNPLYLGNFLNILGIAMDFALWWFVLIICLAFWLYIERIIAAEEEFLDGRFGQVYRDWQAKTPVFFPRLFPRMGPWTPAGNPISIKRVLRRDYNGVLAVASAFLALELLRDLVFKGEPLAGWLDGNRPWVVVFVVALVLFVVLRYLKKYTQVLDEK